MWPFKKKRGKYHLVEKIVCEKKDCYFWTLWNEAYTEEDVGTGIALWAKNKRQFTTSCGPVPCIYCKNFGGDFYRKEG